MSIKYAPLMVLSSITKSGLLLRRVRSVRSVIRICHSVLYSWTSLIRIMAHIYNTALVVPYYYYYYYYYYYSLLQYNTLVSWKVYASIKFY
jgi:hypothetical protein